jgi:hypothetical protein
MNWQSLTFWHAWEGGHMKQQQKRIALISLVLVLIGQTLAWAGPGTLFGG